MNRRVHYLVRPVMADPLALVYPTEIDDATYTPSGALYLLGHQGEQLQEEYALHAVYGDDIIETVLTSYRRSRRFFRVAVTGVGTFLFHAQSIARKPIYQGRELVGDGNVVLARLRSWRPGELDRACRDNGFYFIGFSPQINVGR